MTYFGSLFLGFLARFTLLHTLNHQNLVSNLVSHFGADKDHKKMLGYLAFGQVVAHENWKSLTTRTKLLGPRF